MTTKYAEAMYLSEHLAKTSGQRYAIYNPLDKPVQDLPYIYGFNNGGDDRWLSGVLIAEDGTKLGGHICSHEFYMEHDLGILEGSMPGRHEEFKKHYPDGYRMEFVSSNDIKNHEQLMKAISIAKEKNGESSC